MKQLKALFAQLNTRNGRAGLYSAAVSLFVIGMLLCVNIFVGALPADTTEFDLSANNMFTLSQQTKDVLRSLDAPVTLNWICQPGLEDSFVQRLLERYAGSSSQVRLERIDPDLNPTFVSLYPEELNNNGVIVTCGDRYRYVDSQDFYLEEFSYETYDYVYQFDGENALTSAIDYVTAQDLPTLGMLTGHTEQALGETFRRALTLENVLFRDVDLQREGGVPKDVNILLINRPQQDLTLEETDQIRLFLERGGHLILVSMLSSSETYDNLYGLMGQYGMAAVPGVVFEEDALNYYYSHQELIPQLSSHPITQAIIGNNRMVLMPDSHGLALTPQPGDTLVSLLDTSATSYSKTGAWPLSTYLKEEGDLDGPFSLGALCTRGQSHVLWFSGAYVTEESAVSLSNNLDLFMNSVNWITQRENRISIRPKPMDDPRLTVNAQSADAMKLIFVVLIPLSYLALGVTVFIRRKRR